MTDFKVPQRDVSFALKVSGLYENLDQLDYETEPSDDLIKAIVSEFAKLTEDKIAPLNRIADEEGCTFDDGAVTTPKGFVEAYKAYAEGGWSSVSQPEALGGQGLPPSLVVLLDEFLWSNPSFAVYIEANQGGLAALQPFAKDETVRRTLEQLCSGEWMATMCLTEPHCGSDLGILRTTATPDGDGYRLNGTKIFITGGEHDMADNIAHLVLARLPDAPKGTKGISLFLVPKFHFNENTELGERNSAHCGAIEHKMGMHGSSTCVMNFDNAWGTLLGEPHSGLKGMFVFMNHARLGVAGQGLGHTEVGFQKSLAYAQERLQMRSLSGPKNPEGAADPIIVHPDVRRMLLTQKALGQGGRMFWYHLLRKFDEAELAKSQEDREAAEAVLALLTPVAKGFLSEAALEAGSLAIQCFGGHGFIREWGVEQNYRDSRISAIWEGTTGIQALDLVGRKMVGNRGKAMNAVLEDIRTYCQECIASGQSAELANILQLYLDDVADLMQVIMNSAANDPEEIGAASVDFLMIVGYVMLGWTWLKATATAEAMKASGEEAAEYCDAQLATAQFYFDRILPRCKSHGEAIRSGADNLMRLDPEAFAFL